MTKKIKVILKHSSIEDKIPTAEQLEVGELALNNFKDKEFLSFKNTDGEIVKISPSGNKEVIQNLQNQISGVTSALTNYELSSAHTRDIRNVKYQINEFSYMSSNYPIKPRYFFVDISYLSSSEREKVEPFQNALQNYFYDYLIGRLDHYRDTDIRQGLSEFFKDNLQIRGNKYTQNFVDGLDAYMQQYAFNLNSNAGIYQYLTGSTDVITKSKLDKSNYAKTDYVDNKIGGLENYLGQLKSNIPRKTSELTNDSGYITGVDLSNYDTISDVNSKLEKKLDATAYTEPDLSIYAKKSDIPSVPTKTSQLTNDSNYVIKTDLDKKLDATAYTVPDLSSYAKKSDIPDTSNYATTTQLATKLDATAYTAPDLTSYAKKSDIPTVPKKTSELTNDSGFITGVDLSSYDTIADVDSKLSTKLDATAYTVPDLSSYAKKSDIPTVPTKTSQLTNDSHYTKKVELTQAAYDALTSKDEDTIYVITDSSVESVTSDTLKDYAKKSDIPTVPTKTSQLNNDSNFITGVELADYDTRKQVDSKLATKQDKVNNIVVGKTASYTLQSVTESEWENLSGSAESNTIYFIK